MESNPAIKINCKTQGHKFNKRSKYDLYLICRKLTKYRTSDKHWFPDIKNLNTWTQIRTVMNTNQNIIRIAVRISVASDRIYVSFLGICLWKYCYYDETNKSSKVYSEKKGSLFFLILIPESRSELNL